MANVNRRGDDFRAHNRLLNRLIRKGLARSAVEFYFHHQDAAFPRAFNEAAKGVNGERIDRVYANTRRVLERFIRDGEVRDGRHLHRLALGILRTLALHHGTLSYHRDHPLVQPAGGNSAGGDAAGRPLFATNVDAADHARTDADSSDGPQRGELLAAILREARSIGRLHVRAVQIFRRFAFEFGEHGAYVHLARFAIADERGRVVDFRPWRTAMNPKVRPEARIIRRVRAIHREAETLVRIAAQRLGIVPPRA